MILKNIMTFVAILLISVSVFLTGFDNRNNELPNSYYQVYLGDNVIGIIKSKAELEKYIDQQGAKYKKQYGVKNIYAPKDMRIVKINTYDGNIMSVDDIYKKVMAQSPFTIEAYAVNSKGTGDGISFYVVNKDILKQAIENVINTYVGKERYNAYLTDTQAKIVTTGDNIENVYVNDKITTKKEKVPLNKKIYTDEQSLTELLIFGGKKESRVYAVKSGDNIPSIALANQVATGEILISNPTLASEKSLLYPGQILNITVTNPKISVVVNEYIVEDVVTKFAVQETIDPNRVQGDDEIIQQGVDGLERIASSITSVNGVENPADNSSKEQLKPAVNQIWVRGGKIVPNVGNLKIWSWPTESGYRITTDYAWRINPIRGNREFHQGIDISGTGYGSNIYAANNGTIVKEAYEYGGYGNYIIIDHNNGYYTLYGHLSSYVAKVGHTVARGQLIARMGSTGASTGAHLHFEIWRGMWIRISPWTYYSR